MLGYLFPRNRNQESASVAKKRLLQVIVSEAHHHDDQHSVDLRLLQRDLLGVLAKYYADIDPDQVKVELAREESYSVLELNIMLPDENDSTSK
jgi:cell division topological specificity factor